MPAENGHTSLRTVCDCNGVTGIVLYDLFSELNYHTSGECNNLMHA